MPITPKMNAARGKRHINSIIAAVSKGCVEFGDVDNYIASKFEEIGDKAQALQAEIDEWAKAEQDKRRCRKCGCTEENCSDCIERTGEPCHWVEEDLCSACAPKSRAA